MIIKHLENGIEQKREIIDIKIIYGAFRQNPTWLFELKRCLMQSYGYKCKWMILGEDNYNLLVEHNIPKENLILIDKKDTITDKLQTFYHKTYLIKLAVEQYKKVFYSDIDAVNSKKLDDNFFYQQFLQDFSVVANYKKRKKPDYYKDNIEIPCNCFLYYKSIDMLNELLKLHEEKPQYCDEEILGYWAIKSNIKLLDFNMQYILALKAACPQIQPYYFTHHINAGKDMILDLGK